MVENQIELASPLSELPESARTFSLIIPCFNEEEAIETTITQVTTLLSSLEPFELIVVNDGSNDRTGELLDEICQKHPTLKIVHHDRNRGYGASLKSGILAAKSELIGITDADGTYPTQTLIELTKLAEAHEMVVGSRTGANVDYSKIRRIPKVFLTSYASWIAKERIPDLNSGMRVFRRSVALKYLHMLPDGFSFTTTITLAHLTNNHSVLFHPIDYKRRIGKSKIQPIRDTLRFVQLIARMGMYFAPLRVLAPVILVLCVLFAISIGYDVFVIKNLTDKSVLLLMFTMNTALFGLLADMIEKRSRH